MSTNCRFHRESSGRSRTVFCASASPALAPGSLQTHVQNATELPVTEESATAIPLMLMRRAIDEARSSTPEDGQVHPKVGAVVVRDGAVLAAAHRGELGAGDHAEYTALERKLGDVSIAGSTVYTTLE